MNEIETTKVLGVIRVAYPNSYSKLSEGDTKITIDLWQRQFNSYDYQLVMAAVNTIIANDVTQFAPTIARVKEVCRQLANPNQISEEQAWIYIKKALSNSIYNSCDEFRKLPSICQKLVGESSRLREWAMMNTSEVETIVHSNFLKVYRNLQESERLQEAMPISYKEKLMIGDKDER